MSEEIWVERYRPKTLDDLLIDGYVRKIIEDFEKEIPHLLLTGSPGVGKCLDGDEELEIFVESEEEYKNILEFLEKESLSD